MLTYEDLAKALMGFLMYDTGERENGLHDDHLRREIIKHIQSLPSAEHRALLARITIDQFLSPQALAEGYGPEDAHEFLNWCDDQQILLSE